MKNSRAVCSKTMKVLTTLLLMFMMVLMTGCREQEAKPFVDKNGDWEALDFLKQD